jgi:DNA invertase Pin-like site-specific DNA recombinase
MARVSRRKCAKIDRSQLRVGLNQLDIGDELTVARADRLAQSTWDRLNTFTTIFEPKPGFVSLGDIWGDTTNPHCGPMLTDLCRLAEFERELVRTRTVRGKRAMVHAAKTGRPPKMTPYQVRKAPCRHDAGEPMRDIGPTCNVAHHTILRCEA